MSTAIAVTLLLFGACARRETPSPNSPRTAEPDVLLLTLDTFRADRAGCLGNPGGLTPALDAALRDGLLASNAFASAPLTAIAHSSILTGLEPPDHGVRENTLYTLSEKARTLPGLLRERGFSTAGFIAGLPLEERFGFGNGFDHFDDTLSPLRAGDASYAERSAREVINAVAGYLDGASASRLFLWVHFFDAHHPRRIPAALVRFPAADDYDREIRGLDLELGRLFREFERRRGKPILAVASDHGEGLGGHGELSHGVLLYREVMESIVGFAAPLDSRAKSRLPARVVPEIVRLTDVLPTLLDALGVEPENKLPGRSLLSPAPADLAAYGESYYSTIHYGWSPLLSLRTAEWTYIDAPQPELYDRARDPGEMKNVIEDRPDVAASLAARLRPLIREPVAEDSKAPDSETQEQLASLGYVGGTIAREPDRTKNPKTLIGAVNALFRGMTLQSEGRLTEALASYQRAYQADSENFSVLFQLADCLRLLGDPMSAMSYYRRVIAIQPSVTEAYAHLALLTYDRGEKEAAIRLLEEGLAHSPRSFSLLMTAGDLALEAGSPAKAAALYESASESEPRRPESWIGRATAAEALGRSPDADEFWKRAATMDPENPRIPPRHRPASRTSSRSLALRTAIRPFSRRRVEKSLPSRDPSPGPNW